MIYALLLLRANVNIRDKQGRTPLYYVIDKGDYGLVRRFILFGAKVKISDYDDFTPLMMAAKEAKNVKTLKILNIEDSNINAQDENGMTALMYAARYNNNQSVMNYLIDEGARINATDNKGNNALAYAVRYNSYNIISLLLNRGASLQQENVAGKIPLFLAVERKRDLQILSLLVSRGANVKDRDKFKGQTILMAAVVNYDNPAIINYLIDQGANPTARDFNDKRVVDYLEENNDLKGTDLYWRLNYLEPDKRRKSLLDFKDKTSVAFTSAVIPSAGHYMVDSWWPKGTLFMVGEVGSLITALASDDEGTRGTALTVFGVLKVLEIVDVLNETEKYNEDVEEYNKKAREFNEQLEN